MTIDEQGDTDEETGETITDDTTSDLEPIFAPLTTVLGALILLVGVAILFSWLGVIG